VLRGCTYERQFSRFIVVKIFFEIPKSFTSVHLDNHFDIRHSICNRKFTKKNFSNHHLEKFDHIQKYTCNINACKPNGWNLKTLFYSVIPRSIVIVSITSIVN
jgi:hypothetical protein